MKLFELFLSFCVLASVGKAVKYQATFGEEILPCDSNWPTLDTIIDYTQLNITKLMSGILLLNGNVTIIQDFDKNVAFEVQITFKKKEQGKYVLSPFRKIISNFCLVEFNPQEIWYSTTRKFKGDARQCPPRKGTVFTMKDEEVIHKLDFAFKQFHGQYLGSFHSSFGQHRACFAMEIEIELDRE